MVKLPLGGSDGLSPGTPIVLAWAREHGAALAPP
jgi:hypothetical protein